jgi:DNA integrity scanning protein DisA with diadenylate cyclase activity
MWIFDTLEFVPKNQCENWSTSLIVYYLIGNWLIALSYFLITILLLLFWKNKHEDIIKHWIILLFAAFILLCGTTHLLEGLSVWWPAYRLFTLFEILTGIVSFITAIYLIIVVQFKLKYKTPAQYEAIQKQLEEQIKQEHETMKKVQQINHDLANRAQVLENILAHQGWISAQQLKLSELKNIITNLRSQYNKVNNG